MSGIADDRTIQYVAESTEDAAEDIALALKTLLEQRHLYQSVTLQSRVLKDVDLSRGSAQFAIKVAPLRWLPIDPAQTPGRLSEPPAVYAGKTGLIEFRAPDVKLFCGCASCERTEAFNLVSAEEFLSRESQRSIEAGYSSGRQVVQVFVLSYQCQSCKGVPEVFVVRRQGFRLTNSGRAPIEHVDVSAVIPKGSKKFFSDAVVAHQSGQTLSGLFQLRTLLEQFARTMTGSTATNADVVMEEYMGTLPKDFKDRFPSMRSLYSDLSVDLHAATGSADLFEKGRQQIVEHFEARRLFKIA